MPILKRERHRLALIDAATGGNRKFFLGTDSAPHARPTKETACGCAGCYTAFSALELYAEAFDQAGALDKLEPFASFHGADFYGLPRNNNRILLSKAVSRVAQTLSYEGGELMPLRAGEILHWQLQHPVSESR